MTAAFNSIYSALQGFFSRGFWFAAFLPVTIFAILHLAIAILAFGSVTIFGTRFSLTAAIDVASLTTAAPAIILGLIVTAYAISPLIPRFRGLLEGTYLPNVIHDWIRGVRSAEAFKLSDLIDARRDDLAQLMNLQDDYDKDNGEVHVAYENACALNTQPDASVLATVARSLAAVQTAIKKRQLLNAPMVTAQKDVLKALAVNNPSEEAFIAALRPTVVTDDQLKLCRRTDELASEFEELLNKTRREAFYQHEIVKARVRVAGALKNPRATSFGDARYVVEGYADDVYLANFSFMWPRLLVAIQAEKADDPVLQTIDNAKAQVDFAAMSLALSLTIPTIWLPTLFGYGGPAWLFFAIGVLTPVALRFFYEILFESQLALADIVKSTIDRYRMLVLKMLALPLPTSRSSERVLWEQIRLAEENGNDNDLVYVSPKQT